MSMNRCVRVSSNVDLTPTRAAASACTSSTGCFSRALNPSSLLENAHVFLPVLALIFVGGSTPNNARYCANWGLLISVDFSAETFFSRSSFLVLVTRRWSMSVMVLSASLGSVYMRRVRSISLSSFGSYPHAMRHWNRSRVSSTSFLQYAPYRSNSSGVKSARCLPSASSTSVPFLPMQ